MDTSARRVLSTVGAQLVVARFGRRSPAPAVVLPQIQGATREGTGVLMLSHSPAPGMTSWLGLGVTFVASALISLAGLRWRFWERRLFMAGARPLGLVVMICAASGLLACSVSVAVGALTPSGAGYGIGLAGATALWVPAGRQSANQASPRRLEANWIKTCWSFLDLIGGDLAIALNHDKINYCDRVVGVLHERYPSDCYAWLASQLKRNAAGTSTATHQQKLRGRIKAAEELSRDGKTCSPLVDLAFDLRYYQLLHQIEACDDNILATARRSASS